MKAAQSADSSPWAGSTFDHMGHSIWGNQVRPPQNAVQTTTLRPQGHNGDLVETCCLLRRFHGVRGCVRLCTRMPWFCSADASFTDRHPVPCPGPGE